MLEQVYWIAGIVLAVVGVLAFVLKGRTKDKPRNEQNANLNGDNNQVTQSINYDKDGVDKN